VLEEGWLKVEKSFNEKYLTHTEFGVEANMEGSVMLATTLDDNLRRMGIAREIVNATQQLRKSVGISIDDHVEIFYEHAGS